MRTLAITSPEELRQADHKAVIAWERYMRETERAASSTRHCQLNELSPPSSSLCPDFRAGQQARLAFPDPEPRATDSHSLPRQFKLTMPRRHRSATGRPPPSSPRCGVLVSTRRWCSTDR